jgi:hypothetical protein
MAASRPSLFDWWIHVSAQFKIFIRRHYAGGGHRPLRALANVRSLEGQSRDALI